MPMPTFAPVSKPTGEVVLPCALETVGTAVLPFGAFAEADERALFVVVGVRNTRETFVATVPEDEGFSIVALFVYPRVRATVVSAAPDGLR
jgi:hypothetical protein